MVMDVMQARALQRIFESGDERPGGSFGPLQWVKNHRELSEAGQAESHDVARALIFEGTLDERRYALGFWGAAGLPAGASDALARLYLGEADPDPELRRFLGGYTGHAFSPEVLEALVSRFLTSPERELDLAGAVAPDGRAWSALEPLIAATEDLRALYGHLNTAHRAGRVPAFCALLARKPAALRDALLGAIALPRLRREVRAALGLPP